MRLQLLLREIDYWLLEAKFYISRGEGFDSHVEDAFQRARTLMSELRQLLDQKYEE